MNNRYLSRKFILSTLGTIGGIATALSGVGGTVGVVAGYTGAIVSVVIYVVTEGKIDAARVKTVIDNAKAIKDALEEIINGD